MRCGNSAIVSKAEEVVAKRLPVCIIVPDGRMAVPAVGTVAGLDGNYGSRKKRTWLTKGLLLMQSRRAKACLFSIHRRKRSNVLCGANNHQLLLPRSTWLHSSCRTLLLFALVGRRKGS